MNISAKHISTKRPLYILPIYILCMLVMVSDYKVVSNIVGSITTLLTILFLIVNKNNNYSSFEKKNVSYVFIFLIFYVLTSLFNFNMYPFFTGFIVYLMVLTPFFLFLYIYHTKNVKFMKILLVCFVIIWNIFVFLCFKTCLEFPNLARYMASHRELFIDVINGGGYPIGYGSAILTTYLFTHILNGSFKGLLVKLFVIIEIVFMIMTILVINSFIILLSLLVGLFVAFINRFAKTANSKFFYYCFFGVVLLIVYINIASILIYVLNNIDNSFWNKRLSESYATIVLERNSNHVDERERVYQISLNGIAESPIIGNGYKFGNVFNKDEANGVGNHSTLLDTLAQFGLIGGIPVLLFLLYPLRNAIRKKEDYTYLIPFYVMSCLNPTFKCYHVMLIIYLIIPLMQLFLPTPKYNNYANIRNI